MYYIDTETLNKQLIALGSNEKRVNTSDENKPCV